MHSIPKEKKSVWKDEFTEPIRCSSGYLTDSRYYEETDLNRCPVYRNPHNTLLMKNGNCKFNNVDAYFVDTLNKSMAENEKNKAKNVEYAVPRTKSKEKPSTSANENVKNGHHEHAPSPDKNASSQAASNKIAVSNKSNDSSSDSCGSSFVPAKSKLSEICRSAPLNLDQLAYKHTRSASMCSMPEFADSLPFRINNSESMPNITNNPNGRKLLAASQLNSSTSLSESDNMSEQSGYVSSRKSSAGSTTQVTPTGKQAICLSCLDKTGLV